MIPNVMHFSFMRGTTGFAFRDIHWLCLLSCKKKTGAEKIIVHYDVSGDGEFWDQAIQIPGIEWRKTDFVSVINGHPVTDQRIVCDMYRLNTLKNEGGFFCDLDFLFIGSFNKLRHNESVIGTQCKAKKKLCNALMGAVPNSAFINSYIDAYQTWTPIEQLKWWTFANNVPWTISQTVPVTVLPRPAFYPWCWSNKKFLKGAEINIKGSVAVHLWESLHPTMTIGDLRATSLEPQIRDILDEQPLTHVALLPGTTLQF